MLPELKANYIYSDYHMRINDYHPNFVVARSSCMNSRQVLSIGNFVSRFDALLHYSQLVRSIPRAKVLGSVPQKPSKFDPSSGQTRDRTKIRPRLPGDTNAIYSDLYQLSGPGHYNIRTRTFKYKSQN